MSYSDSFPAQRPSFIFDAANSGRIPPNMTYTRASTANVFDGAKHLSSDNLLLQSSDFDTTWTNSRLASPTANQTDPSGGTDGYTLAEDSSSGAHRLTQSVTATGDLAFTVFAKQNSGTRYLTLAFFNANNDTVLAVYDLAGGSPVTATGSSSTYTSVSTSQTASGNGYYKCVLKATGTVTLAGVNLNDASTTAGLDTTLARKVYTGDGSSSIDVAFASLSTTGATDYNATTTQIHREYAPTLQTAAINAPRFEHSASDSASMGLLVEGQATNINTYSKGGVNGSGVVQWQVDNGSATGNSAVGPDGTLSALHFVPNTTTTAHYAYNNVGSTPSGSTPHTISVYAKAAGYSDIVIRLTSSYSAFANTINATFTLTGDGSVSVTGGTATAAIESCGNGWYRCQVTETTGSSPTGMRPYIYARQVASYAGDGFSGVLLWGWQVEANSFASSLIATVDSAATRASDSASVDLTQAGFNGGPFSIVSETEGGQGVYPRAWTLTDGTLDNRLTVYRNSGTATTSTNWFYYGASEGSAQVSSSVTGSASAGKLAVSYDTNDVSFCASGGSVTNDTSAVIPKNITTLIFGSQANGTANKLNGHIKRLALYSEPLSDSNLQALTS